MGPGTITRVPFHAVYRVFVSVFEEEGGKKKKKKRGGTGGEKRRENPVFYLNTVSRAVYANVYNIYNNFIARISNNATEIKGSYKNFYTSLQQENSFPRFHEL